MTTETQAQKILRRLKAEGELTNVQLNQMYIFRYSARILELRKEGHNIQTVRLKGGLCKFVLRNDEAPRSVLPDVLDRLLNSLYEITANGCWRSDYDHDQNGYARMRHNGRMVPAHRVSYETFVALIGDGLEIDHLCKVRDCISPDHLEAVTKDENYRRSDGISVALAAEQARYNPTVCKRGHLRKQFGYLHPTTGVLLCRACKNEARRQKRAHLTLMPAAESATNPPEEKQLELALGDAAPRPRRQFF